MTAAAHSHTPVRLVLLDRDGTINVKAPEGEYVTSPDELRLLPGADEAIRRLNEAGLPVAVVTNQRGIFRGRLSVKGLQAIHTRLAGLLSVAGAHIDAWYFCPHDTSEGCACRKPAPGMLLEAGRRFEVPMAAAVMVGDAPSDVAAGVAAGARTVQIGSWAGGPAPDARTASLSEAVDVILRWS